MILFYGLTLWQKIHLKKSKRFWKFKETNGYGFPSCLFNMPFGMKNKQIPLQIERSRYFLQFYHNETDFTLKEKAESQVL